jgi:hypothetical protein
MSFLEELAKKKIIEQKQIGEIKNRANEKFAGDIDEVFAEMNIPEDEILKIKGEYFKMPIKKIGQKGVSFDVLKYIPEDSANYYRFVPIGLTDGILEIGVLDPENIQAMDAIQFISAKIGIPFKIFLVSKSDYKVIINNYKGITSQVNEAMN